MHIYSSASGFTPVCSQASCQKARVFPWMRRVPVRRTTFVSFMLSSFCFLLLRACMGLIWQVDRHEISACSLGRCASPRWHLHTFRGSFLSSQEVKCVLLARRDVRVWFFVTDFLLVAKCGVLACSLPKA